jgi:hypothetical protein
MFDADLNKRRKTVSPTDPEESKSESNNGVDNNAIRTRTQSSPQEREGDKREEKRRSQLIIAIARRRGRRRRWLR